MTNFHQGNEHLLNDYIDIKIYADQDHERLPFFAQFGDFDLEHDLWLVGHRQNLHYYWIKMWLIYHIFT